MPEKLIGSLSEQQVNPEKKFIQVQSELEDINGQKNTFNIKLEKDGKPKAAAFFDIDGTLAHLKFVHALTINEMLPGNNPEELSKVHVDGFRLGNSFRELDRMQGIYLDGHEDWKDTEVYRENRLIPFQKEIDEAGNQAHERAAEALQRYGEIQAKILKQEYEKNPQRFEEAKIKPIFRLAELYKRLGIPMAVMTANPRVAMEPITKFLGFSNYFIDIATDENMVGGGKEIAIQYLIDKFEAKGIPVPKGRLILAGDSLRGDIGVIKKIPGAKGRGVLVLEDEKDLAKNLDLIANDPELQKLIADTRIEGVIVNKVPLDKLGKPRLNSRFRNDFITEIGHEKQS